MKRIVFSEMAARMNAGAEEQQKTGALAFSRIMEAEEKVGVATISGYIGYGNATVDEFTKHLGELKAEGCTKLEVVMNSMGGNLFEASGLYDIIKGCGMEVTAKVYGVAASAATLVCCAASKVLISENSRYMVHRARGYAMGTVEEIEAYVQDLKGAEDQIIGIYAERTGKGAEDVMGILKAETWMNAETAVKEGWCDEVISVAAPDAGKKEGAEAKEDKGEAGDGKTEEEKDGEEKKSPPQNHTVLRRMMEAVGVTTMDSLEDAAREVERLRAENERLAAENDGFRGMEGTQARVMAAREAEFNERVQKAVVREMAAMGISPASLPPADAGEAGEGAKEPAMTNERLRKMEAKEARAWIFSHPKEAEALNAEAEQTGK